MLDEQLIQDMEQFLFDPTGYVYYAFPWGEDTDSLAKYSGPDVWQEGTLDEIGEAMRTSETAVRFARASGHGVGKSAELSWLILWFMSTRPDARIVVTANTKTQLQTKLWRELAMWHRLCLNGHWFEWFATSLRHKERPSTWVADAIPWSRENPEAFQGLHGQHTMILFDEACHDAETEVLTEEGWKLFSELDGTERLLTMDPATSQAEYVAPTKLFRAHRKGEMIRYKAKGLDFCVTPNHQMWFQLRYSTPKTGPVYTPWRFGDADALPCNARLQRGFVWQGEDPEYVVIPELKGPRKCWPEQRVPAAPFAELLGWFASEGHFSNWRGKVPYTVGFSQTNGANLERIRELAVECGFEPKIYPVTNRVSQLYINNRQLAEWLLQSGRYCFDKRVPTFVRQGTPALIRRYLEAFVAGDGYERGSGRRIMYTSSEALAGDLQELVYKVGGSSTVTKRALKGRKSQFVTHEATSSRDGFVVSWQDNCAYIKYRQTNAERVEYDGMVYCAEVPPHHLLFTRRNGTAFWSGNSGVDDVIWSAVEGALTDEGAKPLWVCFGNPTRSVGRFYECFNQFKHRWNHASIDSRTAKMTNKVQLQQWIEDYGEDSDFCRVRIKGQFPRVGSTQLIPTDWVDRAMTNKVKRLDDPNTALSVDVARFGDDESVVTLREPNLVLPQWTYLGLDTMSLADEVARFIDVYEPDVTMVDGNGVGGGVVDRLRQLRYSVIDVQTARTADDEDKYKNVRAEIWGRMRDWLRGDVGLPKDMELRKQLISQEYGLNERDKIQLVKKEQMKRDGLPSPDRADSIAFSFAHPIRSEKDRSKGVERVRRMRRQRSRDWMTL